MKKTLSAIITVLSLAACQLVEEMTSDNSIVVLPDGAVELEDTQFGIYYGNIDKDGMGVFSLVLSDARCYQDRLDRPYLDSEGDMLVLRLKAPLLSEDEPIAIPEGDYSVSAEGGMNTINPSSSYIKRLVGSVQSRWDIKEGTISVARESDGTYRILTKDFVIAKGDVEESVEYVCLSSIDMSDYMTVAPSMLSMSDDIVDMPFPSVECIYNGDLFGNGTGNFIVNLSTKGFVNEDYEIASIPGVFITLNFFSRLYSGNSVPVLEEGRYTVSAATSSSLLQRWSLLPGLLLESSPFGTYMYQRTADGELGNEFITSGVVDVKYDDEAEVKTEKAKLCTLTYSFKTSTRTISGEWTGEVLVDNQSGTSSESYLTTLDHDVECDMSKVTGGTLRRIETLHRDNVEEQWDYDIAEAWQLYLQPRDWTAEEKEIPWLQDDNDNDIPDRLEVYCADGDFMILEFVLPLGSQGQIAPQLNRTYTYTLQPALAMDHESYEIYVSRMGRPYDEIFDQKYAEQYPGWAEQLGIIGYDRCNARRGFSWSEDGWRGNWYQHYEKGQHYHLDEYAPAINGWVKVTRTGDDIYDFEWDFVDDNPGTPNRITGSIADCKVSIQLN